MELCSTDLGQEVGNTRLTRAVVLAKLLLVICESRKWKEGGFKAEDEQTGVKKQNNKYSSDGGGGECLLQLLLSH